MTVSGCFAALRQLCSIRRSLPDSVFQSLVVTLVIYATPRLRQRNTRGDSYIPARTVDFNQFSMPQPGHLVTTHERVHLYSQYLHWLRTRSRERIDFKLAMLV